MQTVLENKKPEPYRKLIITLSIVIPLAVAALLTLWSGMAYLRAAWPSLRADAEIS